MNGISNLQFAKPVPSTSVCASATLNIFRESPPVDIHDFVLSRVASRGLRKYWCIFEVVNREGNMSRLIVVVLGLCPVWNGNQMKGKIRIILYYLYITFGKVTSHKYQVGKVKSRQGKKKHCVCSRPSSWFISHFTCDVFIPNNENSHEKYSQLLTKSTHCQHREKYFQRLTSIRI